MVMIFFYALNQDIFKASLSKLPKISYNRIIYYWVWIDMAIVHPQINPVALDLGMIELHWYGLMYLFAFVVAYFLAWVRTKSRTDFTPEMVSDLVFFVCFWGLFFPCCILHINIKKHPLRYWILSHPVYQQAYFLGELGISSMASFGDESHTLMCHIWCISRRLPV